MASATVLWIQFIYIIVLCVFVSQYAVFLIFIFKYVYKHINAFLYNYIAFIDEYYYRKKWFQSKLCVLLKLGQKHNNARWQLYTNYLFKLSLFILFNLLYLGYPLKEIPRHFMIRYNWSRSVSPGKSGCPVKISAKIHPVAQISTDFPYSTSPTSNSGDLYHLVAT